MTAPQGQKGSCSSVAMREYCESQIIHVREQTALQFKAIEDAYEKSSKLLDVKLESINREVQMLRDIASEAKGKASAVSVYVSWVLAAAALVVSLLAVLQ
jgi:hypothetical protein